VISFEKDKMTLRVPTHKATEVGMRSLSSPDVVSRAMSTLKGKAKVKRAMWSRRAQEYEQKINSGDLVAIAEVVRDLHRADEQREQSYSERQLYEAALERLTREVAAVSGSNETEAARKVDDLLMSRAA
jgi:CarD family transcriptional regulator